MGFSDRDDLITQVLLAIALIFAVLTVLTSWLNHRAERHLHDQAEDVHARH